MQARCARRSGPLARLDSKWGFLNEWWYILEDFNLKIAWDHDKKHVHPSYKGIVVPLPHSGSPNRLQLCQQLREALQLVSMVAIADPPEWRRRVFEHCGEDLPEEIPPRFVFNISMREVVNAENPFPLLRYHGQSRDERIPLRMARVLGDTTLEACDENREAIIREHRMAAGGADNSNRDDLDDVGEVDPEAQIRLDTPAWKMHNMPTVHRGDEFWLAQNVSESDTVDILVPGYGFCTIHREKIEIIEPTSAQNGPREPSIRQFMIENQEMDSDVEGMVPLIEIVGMSLNVLAIDFIMNQSLRDEHWEAIVYSCPALHHLSVTQLTLSSFQLVADAFEVHNRSWMTLNLENLRVRDLSSSSILAQVLSDPRSVMSKHLRELSLTLRCATCEELSPFVGMLDVNRFLGVFQLVVSSNAYDAVKIMFSKAETIPVTVYKAPLTIRHMAAFLSTLHQAMPPGATSSSSAKQQLDSFSLSRIFQFAAEATQREMIIRSGLVYDNSSSGDDDNGNA